MRKASKMVAALGLVAAMAVPAMAEVSMTGFYRARGYQTNFFNGTAGDATHTNKTNDAAGNAPGVTLKKDANTATYVDQRFRAKFAAGDENVKAVAFLEMNGLWGSTNADLSADSTSGIAVKNVYLWFKIPDTTADYTVGVQNVTDAYAGTFFGAADVAGVFMTAKPTEALGLRFGAAVPYQPDKRKDESVKLFVGEAKFAATKDVKVGANLYFLQDKGAGTVGYWRPFDTTPAFGAAESGRTNIFMPGVDFAANLGVANLTGFAFYQFGDRKFDNPANAKVKFRGLAGDLRADLNAGPAKVFVEGLYVSGNDFNSTDNKYKGVVVLDDYDFGSGSSTFSRTDMVLLLPAADSIGTAGALTYDVNNHGMGAIHVAAGASMAVTTKLTGKVGLGYLRAAKTPSGVDKELGTEVNASLNYNITKGLDVTGTAAYAFLGDGYTGTTNVVNAFNTSTPVANSADADDPYALIAKVNYAF